MENILFDTGALHHSYINEAFVNRNYKGCCSQRRPISVDLRLGDNKTSVKVTEAVTLKLSRIDLNLGVHVKELDCYVWRMPGTNMIIGLPDILFKFAKCFRGLITRGESLMSNGVNKLSVMEEVSNPDIMYEGSKYEETEEERNSYEPCSFSLDLAHMGKAYDEAMKEYIEMFCSHIDQRFRDETPVELLLKTRWVMDLFVPKHWEGLRKVEPVEISFKSTLPVSLKPKARPINPRMHENAKREYERLTGYIYVPSTSPIASTSIRGCRCRSTSRCVCVWWPEGARGVGGAGLGGGGLGCGGVGVGWCGEPNFVPIVRRRCIAPAATRAWASLFLRVRV